jgi:GntR family transcriptional regulator
MTIANTIREQINNNEYVYGERLPYEHELCTLYNCNKQTMKKSLAILVKEGFILRRRGSGTFVKDPKTISPINKSSFIYTRPFTSLYNDLKSTVLEFTVIQADDFLSSKLQIQKDDFVYHIIRSRHINEKPYALEITYMPINVIPNLRIDHLQNSIYSYIENDLNLKIQSGHKKITSSLSTELEQKHLFLKENEPYIQIEQIAYLSSGVIFEFSLSRHHYKDFEFNTVVLL